MRRRGEVVQVVEVPEGSADLGAGSPYAHFLENMETCPSVACAAGAAQAEREGGLRRNSLGNVF